MLKVKSEMDAFAEGLQVLGVLTMIRMYPDLFKPLFVADLTTRLTAGKLPCYFKRVIAMHTLGC